MGRVVRRRSWLDRVGYRDVGCSGARHGCGWAFTVQRADHANHAAAIFRRSALMFGPAGSGRGRALLGKRAVGHGARGAADSTISCVLLSLGMMVVPFSDQRHRGTTTSLSPADPIGGARRRSQPRYLMAVLSRCSPGKSNCWQPEAVHSKAFKLLHNSRGSGG